MIFFARWWALNRKAAQIDTCDLILGAAQETKKPEHNPYGMGFDLPTIVTLFAHGIELVEQPEPKDLPLSYSSKRALAYAAEEAGLDGLYSIDVHHLVRGVLRNADETSKTMAEQGYTLSSLRKSSWQVNQAIPDKSGRHQPTTRLQLIGWRMSRIPKIPLVVTALLILAAAIAYLHYQQ